MTTDPFTPQRLTPSPGGWLDVLKLVLFICLPILCFWGAVAAWGFYWACTALLITLAIIRWALPTNLFK